MTGLAAFFAAARPATTPALVVRRAALERNLATMQARCDAAGVALRAHGKMHKCPALARRQVELGAVGICCQTVGEAEVFVQAGIADLLITAPVALMDAGRVAALSGEARIAAVVDDIRQIEAYAHTGAALNLVVDIDIGLHRAGCAPSEAVDLARRIDSTPSLTFDGIQAYAGHLQHVSDIDARRTANEVATTILAEIVTDLQAAGLAPARVTGGGTGTFAYDLAAGIFTELQAGSYALMDVEYTDCGTPDGTDWPFEAALFVSATVVSARHSTHVTCDAGLKSLAVDGPTPRVLSRPGLTWRSFGDEHGALIGTPLPSVGERVWIQPGHIDPTVNLHSEIAAIDEDGSIEIWPVAARR